MLEPQNRSLLTELLQPPRGYELTQAVATTFTLDLATALSIPLSFASRNLAAHDDLGIIAALAQNADKISIFTQAGEIRPGMRSQLVTLLEDMVHPVHPPRGIFHPKIWLLEYASEERRAYRFLCLSRNLTDDKSWDLSIRFDGTAAERSERDSARRMNRPLVTLLNRLPELAVRRLPDTRAASLAAFAERVSDVRWELPAGVTKLGFHLLDGRNGWTNSHEESSTSEPVAGLLDEAVGDALLITPFVSPGGLTALGRLDARNLTLVSRPESLDRLPAQALAAIDRNYVLDDVLEGMDDLPVVDWSNRDESSRDKADGEAGDSGGDERAAEAPLVHLRASTQRPSSSVPDGIGAVHARLSVRPISRTADTVTTWSSWSSFTAMHRTSARTASSNRSAR